MLHNMGILWAWDGTWHGHGVLVLAFLYRMAGDRFLLCHKNLIQEFFVAKIFVAVFEKGRSPEEGNTSFGPR